MTEPDQIRSELESYLRHELAPARMSVVKTLIDSDHRWYSTYHTLLTETQGIRLSALQDLKSKLNALESDEKKVENSTSPSGDLSTLHTLNPLSNETLHLETITVPPVSNREIPSDPLTLQGIRYTTLHDELKKLKAEELRMVENGEKKNRTKVMGLRKYWWAVAAGVAVLVIGGYFIAQEKNKPKYVNQYLIDHFDEYVLHDKVRGTAPVDSFDRDKEIGYDLYVLQEFEEAIPYLERRWERTGDTLALFYLGVCYAGLGDDKKLSESVLNTSSIKYNKLIIKLLK